jgi:hypothetical protein
MPRRTRPDVTRLNSPWDETIQQYLLASAFRVPRSGVEVDDFLNVDDPHNCKGRI